MRSARSLLAVLALLSVAGEPLHAERRDPVGLAQAARLRVSVQLVDAELFVRPVPRHVLLLKPVGREGEPIRIVVGFDGRADVAVPLGEFSLESERPAIFQGHAYRWKHPAVFRANEVLTIDLSVDTALIDGNPTADAPAPAAGGRGDAPPAETPTRPAAILLTGEWAGTYAGLPARLSIVRHQGPTFSGTLRVTTKTGSADSEIAVEGQWDPARSAVELKEVKVTRLGAAPRWNLGTGSGTVRADGDAMSGTGRDGRQSYDWTLTRQVAGTVAGRQQAAAASSPGTTNSPASSTDLVGEWDGMYANNPARLRITRQDGSEFAGVLTVTTRSGQAPTELEVEGRVTQTTLELRETKVTAIGAARTWNLGRGTGTVPAGGRQMTGTGSDGRTSYRWSFTKR